MAKTISWGQRSCVWLTCCWTLAVCSTSGPSGTTASHLDPVVHTSPTPAPAVMIVRGDGPEVPGDPAPPPGGDPAPPPTHDQRPAYPTFTHPYRNPTVGLAQTSEAATVSLSAADSPTPRPLGANSPTPPPLGANSPTPPPLAANTLTASATHANPSTPPPPPAETQTTTAGRPSVNPSGAVPPPPTATPSTPTQSSSPTPPPAANQTAPIPTSSAPPPPTVKTPARSSTVKAEPPCDIDPCVHLQPPCPEVKEAKGWSCACPGASSAPSMAPGPVVALEVTGVWPRAAGVRWCAPYSTLTSFLVWVLRRDGSTAVSNASVSSRARRTDVFGLEAGQRYSVCVSAQKNGASPRASHTRCVAVATPRDGEAIALYVLVGGCVALLLMAAVLSVCLHRQCQRGRGGGATPPTALLNPTATQMMLHEPRLASLVSIPNPAYSSHAEEHHHHPTSTVNTHQHHAHTTSTVNTHHQHTHTREQQQAKKTTNVNNRK